MIAPGKDDDIFFNYANAADLSLLDWLSYEKSQKENNNGNPGFKKREESAALKSVWCSGCVEIRKVSGHISELVGPVFASARYQMLTALNMECIC